MAKILVVEDNADFREILRLQLRFMGHEVIEAASGPEAIEKATEDSPDLITMDFALPGMDGIETTTRLKQDPRTAHIPVLGYSASYSEDDRPKAIKAGMADFLVKPIPPAVLNECIESLLFSKKT